MKAVSEVPAGLVFGRFRVLPHRRELLADGQPIKLGGRAFDMLMALIDARGAVIGKHALMTRVWPDQIVEENNLQAQISDLRAAFGAERHLIRTVSGRGYQFTGDIRVLSEIPTDSIGAGVAAAEPVSALPPTNLPAPVSELVGRDGEVGEITSLASAHRLLTLTGAGGIGKTRLALAAARRLLPEFADGVWLVELAALADPALVPTRVARVVGLEFPASAISTENVAKALSGKRLLLVLDNCEHVIDAAAIMAEVVLRANPAVHVIATSREPLRVEGEWIHPVPPLAVPSRDNETGDDPLQYGALQLFSERAQAAAPHFVQDRRFAVTIAAICRRLDGIPLAIELAAARAATLGIEEVAAHLDDRFHLLTDGRRTALPRHQTLRATLDWSYELLPETERVILRRLAIFAGAFGLEAAGAVVASSDLAPAEVVDGLASLAAKSLVAAEVDAAVARYRLLDTTRAYALEKLAESGEHGRVARRLAEYGLDVLARANTRFEQQPSDEQAAEYRLIDNLRTALDWAFSPEGDASLGVALTAAAVPLLMHLSLMDECRTGVERALAALAGDRDARCEMKLQAALGESLMYTRAVTDAEVGAAWTRALELAEQLGDLEYQLRALWGVWAFHMRSGQHRVTSALVERFCGLAAKSPDQNDRLVGERMMGESEYLAGNLAGARGHLEHMLSRYAVSNRSSPTVRFQMIDQGARARAILARILWLEGFPDQAMRTAESSVGDLRNTYHGVSFCYDLALSACPLALLTGDLDAADYYVEMLSDRSRKHGLVLWQAWGRYYQGVLVVTRGDLVDGSRLLRTALDQLGEAKFAVRFVTFLGEVAEALGRAGRIADGLGLIEEALARFEDPGESWFITDLRRSKGELLLLQSTPRSEDAAEDLFRQALDWARRQGALSWELRAASSLARSLRDQGRSADALSLLQPVYDRFTEGFDTADLKSAKALLDDIQN